MLFLHGLSMSWAIQGYMHRAEAHRYRSRKCWVSWRLGEQVPRHPNTSRSLMMPMRVISIVLNFIFFILFLQHICASLSLESAASRVSPIDLKRPAGSEVYIHGDDIMCICRQYARRWDPIAFGTVHHLAAVVMFVAVAVAGLSGMAPAVALSSEAWTVIGPASSDARLHPAFNSNMAALSDLVKRLPKAELHIHIEGTLEVDMMFELARRNGIELPYADEHAAREARANFTCLEVRQGGAASVCCCGFAPDVLLGMRMCPPACFGQWHAMCDLQCHSYV